MITLFDSPFSPFARKIRLILEHKKLEYEALDALLRSNHDRLKLINGRVEVPVFVDGDIVVVNSADIAAYLEFRYPQPALFPSDPAARVKARAWERTADTLIDPILIDISYWHWADRPDEMPEGLLDAARRDLDVVYRHLEQDLAGKEFLCGDLSIADIALFPHLTGVKQLKVEFSNVDHPNLANWFKRMRSMPLFLDDVMRTRGYFRQLDQLDVERDRLFWRGDRIEWLLARGFHDWFFGEIAADRVIWPGLALPPQKGPS